MNLLSLLSSFASYHLLRNHRVLAPSGVLINLTYRCNSRCKMCNIWKMRPENELTYTDWQTILGEGRIFRKIMHLTIAGGEPTLHPDLSRLVALYIEKMPRLQLLSFVTHGFHTNRVLAFTKEAARLCQARGIMLSITVSLDGVGSTHDELRGTPHAFEKTSATLLALKSLQKSCSFSFGAAGLICRENLRRIRDAQSWCESREIGFSFQLIGFHETYVQNLAQIATLDFGKTERDDLYSLLGSLARDRDFRKPKSFLKSYYWADMLALYKQDQLRTTPCPFATDAFVFDSFGDVYYCLSEPKIGNVRSGRSLDEIYYHPNNVATRKDRARSVCLSCNSGCFVTTGLAKDLTKLAWFALTGKLGRVGVS